MSKTKSLELRCAFCRRWFPSPLQFPRRRDVNLDILFATVVKCPNCGLDTHADSENFRARFDDGTKLGNHRR